MAVNPLWTFLEDIKRKGGISEVMINDPFSIHVEREGHIITLDKKFTEGDVDEFCQEVAKQNEAHFDPSHPFLDGVLPGGGRINLVHSFYSGQSHAITIRFYLPQFSSLKGEQPPFGLGPRQRDFLLSLVRARCSLLISGGTGAGKTTLLNSLLQEADPAHRYVTIEETRELFFKSKNIVRLEARLDAYGKSRLSIRDLVRNALRMRPDRLIIGELRGAEAFDYLMAINTGHEGSMSSIHANSAIDALVRLENLVILGGENFKSGPPEILRKQISEGIDFVIHLSRTKAGTRMIQSVIEVTGVQNSTLSTQEILKSEDGNLVFTGLVPSCRQKLEDCGFKTGASGW